MREPSGSLDFADIRRRFDRAAAEFDHADFVHRETAAGLIERMAPMRVDARRVLDLGSATGSAGRELRKRFKRSQVIAFDISLGMLRQAKKKRPRFSKPALVQGSAVTLPFKTACIDVVYSNLLLPWLQDVRPALGEVARVLRKGGLFVFSTLGPDSLSELRQAWAAVDGGEHVNRFADMHDVGDGLVQAGLSDPVLDTDFLDVTYGDTASLYEDLTRCGGRNCLAGRRSTLTGKGRFGHMEQALRSRFAGPGLELRLELIYGHAWGAGPRSSSGEYHVAPNRIGRRSRRLLS